MAEPEVRDDEAMLYVLGQLEGRRRVEFEGRLATSPELRALVQEMESASEALALAAPQVPPPRRVWSRIAARIEDDSRSGSAVRSRFLQWKAYWRLAWRSGWAVAGVLAVAWAVHLYVTGPRSESGRDRRLQSQQQPVDPPDVVPPENRPAFVRGEDLDPATLAGFRRDSSNSGTGGGTRDSAFRLRARVQQLSTEVADLNRVLAEQTLLPPGAGRFQIFRLGTTNNALRSFEQGLAATQPTPEQAAVLEQWLARALARQLVDSSTSLNTPPDATGTTGTTGTSTTTGSDATSAAASGTSTSTSTSTEATSLANNPPPGLTNATTFAGLNDSSLRVVEFAHPGGGPAAAPSSASASDASDRGEFDSLAPGLLGATGGLGFYSLDTGSGSIALVMGQSVDAGLSFQLWAVDSETRTTISLGTTSAASGPFLMRFQLDPNQITNPAFMITMEPAGGSAVPTGQVVVGPPLVVGSQLSP